MKLLLVIFLLVSNVCYSNESMKVVKKGEVASFDGVLVSKEQMEEFRRINEENKLLKEKVLTLENIVKIDEIKLKYYADELTATRSLLIAEQANDFWAKAGYFALGVIVTGVAAKSAIESTRR